MKNIRIFLISEKFPFLVVKFSIYLNRHVFIIKLAFRLNKTHKRQREKCQKSIVGISVRNILPQFLEYRLLKIQKYT